MVVKRIDKGEYPVTLSEKNAIELETQRVEMLVRQAMANRPTAGLNAQLAEAMRLSKGSVNPKTVLDLIRRLRNG